MHQEIPIWHKACLTIEEASEYSHIGINRLRDLTNEPNCPFVLYIGGRKKLIKKKAFDRFLENSLEL